MEPIRLIRDLRELRGTVYFEILPGPYAGKCWNEGSVFLGEEVFGLLEPVFSRHHPGLEHYGFNTIASGVWKRIAADLRQLSRIALAATTLADLRPHLAFLYRSTDREFEAQFETNKTALASLARELAAWAEQYADEHECISVLGI